MATVTSWLTQILHHSQVRPKIRRGINSTAHSASPLKWTKMLSQSDEDNFSYETVVLTTGGCCNWCKMSVKAEL